MAKVRSLILTLSAALALAAAGVLTLDTVSACAEADTIAPNGSAASLAAETLGHLICRGD